MIPERLAALRQEMEKRDIAVYIVPTADFHESEYVGEYFKARRFITGFTGSTGTAVITRTKVRTVDRRKIFCAGGKTVRRNNCDTVPYGRGTCSYG